MKGEYPSGVIDWGTDQWKISVPEGGFGTFNIALVTPQSPTAEFHFPWPRIFAGIDVYNAGASPATLTIHSPGLRELSFTIKPGQLQRLRTPWRDPTTTVIFELKNAESLRFDNLAYIHE